MALNDWADRDHDGRTRPDRPIPSGGVAPGRALTLAASLLVLGPVIAALVDPRAGVLLGLASLLAAFYDLAGRGPWIGPLLLGLCRALNLSCGVTFGLGTGSHPSDGATHAAILALPAAYGTYVFVVSRLGRLEDREDEIDSRRFGPRALVALAALLLLTPAALVVALRTMPWIQERALTASFIVGAGVGLGGAFGLLQRAFAVTEWNPGTIGATMGMALRRLLVFTSSVAILTGGPHGLVVGFVILLGYPLSHGLRKVFPPS